MNKIIIILLFLFYMNAPGYAQNFNLTANGLKQIQIGDTISLQGKILIKPVRQGKDFLEINFWGIEYFDYYYIEHSGLNITLDSSVIVKDIFLYSEKIKGKEVGGILISVNKQYYSLLVALLNRVFGL